MRLRHTIVKDLSRVVLREVTEPDGPRMHFHYLHADDDPNPDVLVLGDYDHPDTGNALLGGINLHYLSPQQLRDLKELMPQILQGTDLKQRYQIGVQLLPAVFDEYYRTYDTQYIQPIQPDALPGWEPQPMPNMGQRPPQRPPVQPPVTKPMLPRPGPAAPPQAGGIPPRGPRPMSPMQPPMGGPGMDAGAPQAGPSVDQADMATLANAYKQRMQQAAAIKAKQDEQLAQVQATKKMEQERNSNLKDLMTPSNGEDPLAVGKMESITYYSPVKGRYITESVRL